MGGGCRRWCRSRTWRRARVRALPTLPTVMSYSPHTPLPPRPPLYNTVSTLRTINRRHFPALPRSWNCLPTDPPAPESTPAACRHSAAPDPASPGYSRAHRLLPPQPFRRPCVMRARPRAGRRGRGGAGGADFAASESLVDPADPAAARRRLQMLPARPPPGSRPRPARPGGRRRLPVAVRACILARILALHARMRAGGPAGRPVFCALSAALGTKRVICTKRRAVSSESAEREARLQPH